MTKHFTIEQLAKLTHSEIVGDPTHIIRGVDDIKAASPQDATFLANLKYKEALKTSQAGLICIDKNCPVISGKNYLICENPSEAFQLIAEAVADTLENATSFTGIHPTAVVDPSSTVEAGVNIGPYSVIDGDVTIKKGTTIYAHVYVGPKSTIGENCTLYPGAIIRENCHLGNRVILQPGAIIGSCGYGYLTSPQGVHTKLDQIGNVVLEDDVEIGASTTIDRARFKSTRIGKGTKIDNLVQIGHNVQIGQHNIIVSQTGIAGSSKTGRNVMMGGQVGIVGHVELGDGVMIATRGGVSKNLKEPGAYGGSPVVPMTEFNKQQVLLRKIATHVDKIKKLEKEVQQLKESIEA